MLPLTCKTFLGINVVNQALNSPSHATNSNPQPSIENNMVVATEVSTNAVKTDNVVYQAARKASDRSLATQAEVQHLLLRVTELEARLGDKQTEDALAEERLLKTKLPLSDHNDVLSFFRDEACVKALTHHAFTTVQVNFLCQRLLKNFYINLSNRTAFLLFNYFFLFLPLTGIII